VNLLVSWSAIVANLPYAIAFIVGFVVFSFAYDHWDEFWSGITGDEED